MTPLENPLKAFARASRELLWQRQATYAGATLLAVYYLDMTIGLFCYAICQLSELIEFVLTKHILAWDGLGETRHRNFLNLATLSTAFNAVTVSLFVIVVSLAEGPSIHIGPLFFLLAAALYAAMNNCQLRRILIARMAIYSAVLVFVPAYDLWLTQPPLSSDLWSQLGVVVFVLYFLIACTNRLQRDYHTGQAQLAELRAERDKVNEAYQIQSQFVSVVSHELRTPLTSIKGSLDLINGGKLGVLPDKAGRVAGIAHKSCNRLAVLIDDLLDFQKLRSGNMSFDFEDLDLAQLVREAVEANRAFGDGQEVTIILSQTCNHAIVRGDRGRLMQVMANVLSNAAKFSGRGDFVQVELERHASVARILVRDNGIGIPDDARETVFAPFKQVDTSDKRAHGGTGLGMSICKQILEGHDGMIDYVSELGIGTTFVIELELSEPAVATQSCELGHRDPGRADGRQRGPHGSASLGTALPHSNEFRHGI